MKYVIYLSLTIIIGIFLISCTQSPPVVPEETFTDKMQLQSTVTPSVLLVFTPTNGVISPKSSPTATETIDSDTAPTPNITATLTKFPTPLPEVKLKIQCLNINDSLPQDQESTGILVLDNQVEIGEGKMSRETYFMDMATGTQTVVTQQNESLIDFAVSPDRNLIAYYQVLFDETGKEEFESNLVITDADGQHQIVLPWEDEWGFLTAWLNNQQIVIDLDVEDESSEVAKWSTFLVLNPFTGEREILTPEYPNIYDLKPLPFWSGWGQTSYDPFLDRVVYLRMKEDGSPWNPDFVLWDIKNHQSLAAIDSMFSIDAIPKWSYDSERFALAIDLGYPEKWPVYEIFIVSKEGDINQLTNLSAFYPWIFIHDYSWSPNGRYLAFWFTSWMEESPNPYSNYERYLAIVDTESGEAINFCVPGDFFASFRSRIVPPPLWSPDGSQLIVQNRFSAIENCKNLECYTDIHSRVILIDINQGIAIQIAEDMKPVGWMAAQP